MVSLIRARALIRPHFLSLFFLLGVVLARPCPARAMGVATLPAVPAEKGVPQGPVTVWYPSGAGETVRTMGDFKLSGAWDSAPVRGNRALIVLSHGSGGSATTYFDMARVLVDAGFIVGAPEHDGDNWLDQSKTGPASWKQRPAEISAAIDRIQGDPRFAPLLDGKKVGLYGMSAGGLTVLTFSGATWSLNRLVKHCADHFDGDAWFCAYREMTAPGGLDGETAQRLKAQFVDGARSGMVDPKEYGFEDPRVKAVVAAVPVAAVIDPASLRAPRVPTALISAEMDRVLAPRWHVLAIERACPSCEVLGPLKNGGHLSILSPLPESVAHHLGSWAEDPRGFDRASLGPLYRSIAQFFLRFLGADQAH
jgi:predicted dienelactone hydrolase